MVFFRPRCPVSLDHKEWLEDSMLWLHGKLQISSFCEAPTVLPTTEFFPEKYEASEAGVNVLLGRVMKYMGVSSSSVRLEIYTEGSDDIYDGLPQYSFERRGSAGHMHPQKRAGKYVIGVEEKNLSDPFSLVATLAHELGHVILLGRKYMRSSDQDHEHMTDLVTVYLGFGVFTANSAFQYRSYSSGGDFGWSASRQGYLSEAMFGYALALYARMRGERDALWLEHLDKNILSYYKASRKFIEKTNSCAVPRVC